MLGSDGNTPSLKGSTITVTLVEGRSMPAAKAYSCILKLSAKTHTSAVSSKTVAPKWNQDFNFEMMEGDTEVQLKVFQKRFCIGEVVVSLQPFIRFEATKLDKWYKIKSTSHVEVEGEIHVVTHLHLRQANLLGRKKEVGVNRTSSHLALLELETAALTKDLLDNLPTGPKTALERMEQAVLEEHDFISKELARVTKTDDSDSQKKQTIQEMLDLLVHQSDALQLAPENPLAGMAPPAITTVVVDSATSTDAEEVQAAAPSRVPAHEISPSLARLVQNLADDQRKQREALLTLQSHLKEDEDTVDFVHGGGIKALLDIVTGASSESFQLKALEHLSTITVEDAPRRHIDLLHMMRTLQPLLTHTNEDIAVLAASSFTNGCMSVNENKELRDFVCNGEATEPLLALLESSHEYIHLRALWGLSNISFKEEQELAEKVVPKLVALLKSSKKKEALQMAALLITNIAAYEANLELLLDGTELLEALLDLLSSAFAVVVVQALKAFTNLAQSAVARDYLCTEGMTEKLTGKLRAETPYNNVKMQSAWLVSSMAQDEATAKRLVELGYVDAVFQLLSDEGGRQQRADIRLKALWALINMSVFTDLSEQFAQKQYMVESVANLCTCGQSAVRLHALKLLSSILSKNSSAEFMQVLVAGGVVDAVLAVLQSSGRGSVGGGAASRAASAASPLVPRDGGSLTSHTDGAVLHQACFVASLLLDDAGAHKHMKGKGLYGALVTLLSQPMQKAEDGASAVEDSPLDGVLWLIHMVMHSDAARQLFIGAGVLRPLYNVISISSKNTRELALAVLSLLIADEDCKAKVLEHYLDKSKPSQ